MDVARPGKPCCPLYTEGTLWKAPDIVPIFQTDFAEFMGIPGKIRLFPTPCKDVIIQKGAIR